MPDTVLGVPRAGQVKPPSDQRLPDHISIGVLTRVFPPELVDRVVAEAGRKERRQRLLPARVVVYYVLAMALFADCSYGEVMRQLVEGLRWAAGGRQLWPVPTKGAIFLARQRLGSEPLVALFGEVAAPLAAPGTAGAYYRDLRLVSIDGTCIDVADTEANDKTFGRAASGRGEGVGAYPQLRLVGIAECGTHALFKVATGAYTVGEQTLADEVLGALEPGMVCLADRGFYSFSLWDRARATGAELLWRTKSNHRLPVLERLADGSYRSQLFASEDRRRQVGVDVRVIEYAVEDPGRPASDTRYRLITTILDPERAPAAELAPLYPQRWEFETTLDELKSHQRGPRVVLRSKLPELVIQELYGYLCLHYAIRWLMHAVAIEAGHDPDQISFISALRVARRTTRTAPGFSPQGTRRRPPASDR